MRRGVTVRRFGRVRARTLVIAIAWSVMAFGGGAPAGAAGPGVATMASGDHHACAVRTDRTVWCWGAASWGQLGDGTTGDAVDHLRTTPVQVLRGTSALKGVAKITAGAASACAVRTDGTVWCWGLGTRGQLGDGEAGTGHHRTKAAQVRRGTGYLTDIVHLSAGYEHVCALRAGGSVWCWGRGDSGQLGDGASGADHLRSTAVRVRQGSGYLEDVTAIATGYLHTCAIKQGGSVWCWGRGDSGQLGDGASGADHHRTKARRVLLGSGHLTRAAGISAGGYHTCVRRTDGTAWCWGLDEYGQLGDGSVTPYHSKPVRVRRGSGALTKVTGIGTGMYGTCARRSGGAAWCWGDARSGQLGDGTTGDPIDHVRAKPVRVVRSTGPFTEVRKLDGGAYHTCALRMDRSVWCWGSNASGQAGRGSHDADPHPYPRKVLFP